MIDRFEEAKQHFFKGIKATERAEYELAEREFRESLDCVSDRPSTLINLQAVLVKLCKFDEALTIGRQILSVDPQSSEAYLNSGNAYRDLGDLTNALVCYKKSIEINPENLQALNNFGILQIQLGNLAQAEGLFRKALILDPYNSDTHNNMGMLYKQKREFKEAIKSFNESIRIEPKNPNAYNNLGNLYLECREYRAAENSFMLGLAIDDKNADLHYNLGNLYSEIKCYDLALDAYSKAKDRNSNIRWLLGRHLSTKAKLCLWDSFETDRDKLLQKIDEIKPVCVPFDALCFTGSAALQKKAAETFTNETLPLAKSYVSSSACHDRVRIGYLSCDFRDHAVSYLMSGVLKTHDRDEFEVFCFDIGEDDASVTRQRIVESVENFIIVDQKSDYEVAQIIRSHGIDILVDLTGHTRGARTAILCHRPAPIQVNYLGYPGTMGAPNFIDYIIADSVLLKPGTEAEYSEKVIYLSNCFQANDADRSIGHLRDRSFHGLPEFGFVFASFAHSSKINPETFNVWLSILKSVPESVLWLVREHSEQEKNLVEYAAQRGVKKNRFVFAEITKYADHLSRYKIVDLVLDTFPFNGGTTTSDALWAGAPVLTCSGEAFSSRMSTSLLTSIGLPELVSNSLMDYEAKAIDLAMNIDILSKIREKLSDGRANSSLFNTVQFTDKLESAYRMIFSRSKAGLPPERIDV